jgi:hypothetical protein
LLQKAKKLKLVGCEKISVLFGGPKKKQLEFGLNKIKKKLDITFIICKLIEVDKLKQLLLNKE